MTGTIAVTDSGWYRFLRDRPDLREVNFWRPSARRSFLAPEFSPSLFKLRAPENAICGFAYFAQFTRLPVWLAWEVFEEGNGVKSLEEMEARLSEIRQRIRYESDGKGDHIGCTLLVDPVFFPEEAWVRTPIEWPVRTQADMKFDLTSGDVRRAWEECLARASELRPTGRADFPVIMGAEPRYGDPVEVRPRRGQRSFRILVTDAYGRACAITNEHSLPALDAAHIVPYDKGGEHVVGNGILLRSDVHRLFDKGYLTVTPEDLRVVVSGRLRSEFRNGRTYYPLQDTPLSGPVDRAHRPDPELLRWHNENVFAA